MTEQPTHYLDLLHALYCRGIYFEEPPGSELPPYAAMQDQDAPIPQLIVSPGSEWGLSETLQLLESHGMYEYYNVSVRGGGAGHANRASCDGIMINLSFMVQGRVVEDILVVEPGITLGRIIDLLTRAGKAVPHGESYQAAVGGHFLAAGWDTILARKYGLSCQSVLGGRVVLWDGRIVDVDERTHPDLLWAMRGGLAAGVGVVSQLHLELIDEPAVTSWCQRSLQREELALCVNERIVERSFTLPREISVAFRLQFEPDVDEPICRVDIQSLWGAADTMARLRETLGERVAALLCIPATWAEGTLLDIRLLPGSDFLRDNPGMLAEATDLTLRENPSRFWDTGTVLRQIHRSRFTSLSSWVLPDCDALLVGLHAAFITARHRRHRSRMCASVSLGGGRATELRETCAMPMGEVLARFELHWNEGEPDESWCQGFTERVARLLASHEDPRLQCPYRGDIWLPERGENARLDAIAASYRHAESPLGRSPSPFGACVSGQN